MTRLLVAFAPLLLALAAAAPRPTGAQAPRVAAPGGGLTAGELRTEARRLPLGLDEAAPRLSWVLASTRAGARDQRQTAYRVLAASTPDALREGGADLWDSGRVPSSASVQVPYAGRPLRSGQRVYWAVRVWDEAGRPSPYSAPAWWEMGLLAAADWRARWIAAPGAEPASDSAFYGERPAPLLRKSFVLAGRPVRRARAYVTGLGYYELRLNGAKVGDHELDPGWTDYDHRVLYATYDVTAALRAGENV
jgi:alpha-L-rhamnosidase